MKRPESTEVIASYSLPPHEPASVREAETEFGNVADMWARAKGEKQDAHEALKEAQRQDAREIVDAALQGKAPKDPQRRERAAQGKIEELETRIAGLFSGVHQAGNSFAREIERARDEWIGNLEDAEADAAARLGRAVEEARAALADLKPIRSGIEWLERFEYGPATVGRVPQFAGGRLRVAGTEFGPLRNEQDPQELLELVAKAVHRPVVPKARVHRGSPNFVKEASAA